MALAVVVMITVALAVLAHAALLLSRTEALLARADARRVEGTYRAAAAVAGAEAGLDSLPGSGPLDPAGVRVDVVRLSREVGLLLSPVAGVRSGEARARLLYSPDPGTRVARRSAGVVVGVGVLRSPGAVLSPAEVAESCPPGSSPPAALPVWEWAQAGVAHPALGPVPLSELVVRLPARAPGPIRVDSTLHAGIRGSAEVSGEGRVLLAVEGDLVLGPDASLSGWVWVEGELTLTAGARFTGLADVGGSLRLETGSEFRVDPCAGVLTLGSAPDARRPWGIGPLAWRAR